MAMPLIKSMNDKRHQASEKTMPFLDGGFYGGSGASKAVGERLFCWVLLGAASPAPPVIGALPYPPSRAGATTGSHLPQINHLPPLRASQCNQGAGKPLGHQGVKRLRQGK